MGRGLIFLRLPECDEGRKSFALIGLGGRPGTSGKQHRQLKTVPETDTGGQVEYTKALERRVLKELGKLPPYLRKKEAPQMGNHLWGAQARG